MQRKITSNSIVPFSLCLLRSNSWKCTHTLSANNKHLEPGSPGCHAFHSFSRKWRNDDWSSALCVSSAQHHQQLSHLATLAGYIYILCGNLATSRHIIDSYFWLVQLCKFSGHVWMTQSGTTVLFVRSNYLWHTGYVTWPVKWNKVKPPMNKIILLYKQEYKQNSSSGLGHPNMTTEFA